MGYAGRASFFYCQRESPTPLFDFSDTAKPIVAAGEQGAPAPPLPDLCHKCGRSCKSATTFNTHDTLLKMAEAGDKEAIDFLEVFEPFESIEAARAVVPEQVAQVIDTVENRDDMKVEELTFYHCRYVTPEGLCGIYERRPRCCREAPGHGWSVMPPGCGFEGWQFLQRESQTRLVRDVKQGLFAMEQLSPDGKQHPLRPEESLDELRAKVKDQLAGWKRFGSEHW